MNSRRGSLRFLTGLSACVAMTLALACPMAAQNQPAQASQATSGPVAPEEQVLQKKSIFFPDLATNRKPLTAEQKFRLSIKNSISPSAILGSAFGAGINQATNSPEGYGQGAEGYGKRLGASMAGSQI